ncbi:type II secretion system F family protein [Peptacetobacter sp.]|uniref:type II secretion system F family protein n=1 Tax=Peptacetobacter sp. TaxID=2991975 RepID=UPI002630646E|nr:type II secretion system F family protein [Peptacetobacter sp.]
MREKYLLYKKNFKYIDTSIFDKIEEFQKIKSKDLRIICSQISILLDSGLGIDEIIYLIGETQKKQYKSKFNLIERSIKKGYSIENSFRTSNLFSEFFYNMIACGENSGKLSIVMDDMSRYYERDYKIKSKLKSVMIYPIILLIMMTVSLIFIMYEVIPNFAFVFESNNITPPLFSYIVIKTMLFIRKYMNILLPIVITIPILLYISIKNNEGFREQLDKIKCKLPIINKYYMMFVTATFSRNLYLMIKSGIPIVESIKTSSNIIDNKYIKEKINISIRYINRGNSISKSINLSGVFSNMFVSMLKNGEESGNIEKSLSYINDFFENELDIMLERAIKFIEPMLTIIIGLIIGSLIIAIVMPMFDAITSI